MAGRRRGARAGRGWDAAPPRAAAQPAGDREPAEHAREICLRQLAVRPRTRAELTTALRRNEIPDEVIAQILDRYTEVGLIDDEAFAQAWVTSRHHGKGLSRRALASELRQRGVDDDCAAAALDELDPGTEAATARALVDRKLRSARGDAQSLFRRLVGMLARKGYPASVAFAVVKEALADRDAAIEDLDPAEWVD
ncbi:regulatory protein RecX [Pilimelia columellifera]|uniref:Regulatory protein RecX n=1 Tax=Pilimelia columellifera subsp. columellifera TaxID=706583 RepID=A0ABP6AAC3_9ACTN